ncbi:MAG: hypothetical protein R3F59_26160 [Myxococcota bacterium]
MQERILAAMGVELPEGSSLGAVIRANGPTLVVLDTCDRCAPAVAALAAGDLAEVTLLVTSRVPVAGVAGLPVPPLAAADAAVAARRPARWALDRTPLPEALVARAAEATRAPAARPGSPRPGSPRCRSRASWTS